MALQFGQPEKFVSCCVVITNPVASNHDEFMVIVDTFLMHD